LRKPKAKSRILAVRLDQKLYRRMRVQVAREGRPQTIQQFVADSIAAKLASPVATVAS
jgi:hypothetical protein